MDCSQIDEDVLDEVVLGRSTDGHILKHLVKCDGCRERLKDHKKCLEIRELPDRMRDP